MISISIPNQKFTRLALMVILIVPGIILLWLKETEMLVCLKEDHEETASAIS